MVQDTTEKFVMNAKFLFEDKKTEQVFNIAAEEFGYRNIEAGVRLNCKWFLEGRRDNHVEFGTYGFGLKMRQHPSKKLKNVAIVRYEPLYEEI